ncbi:MAG: 16S rRNA (cytosine(1402)-N(4))-methyltransferase RsmH [Bacteroidales bacterium]|nr:16S rRNA (cytosine(1402)-N(4))-methyltransferase RsmH [Bacteroidales bacterium]MDD3906698.1 16S rRNA (cytosine(1402)-N(4))-methyltransferase RsmH [Bacteroidales bacterium]MDD4712448.1 16S rRNA (cytosine(1402)-N(4))-methyltransferase RsmH [Bacteroidales bacterium]
MSEYHIPVLLHACIDGLDIKPEGTYVDVTFGGGGHSREIISHLTTGKLYGFDQDEDAEQNIPEDPHFVFVRSNFRYLSNFLRYYDVDQVDGILADLGVSSHHFDDSERGFSFRFEEGNLDMRMNKKAGMTAADVVNTYSEENLANVFYKYGELKNSRRLASGLVKYRETTPVTTVASFLEIIKPFFGREKEKKDLARVFQALRIEVNQEMTALELMLLQALKVLKPGGRLVVMTYHSLEDRLVKNFMKTGNFEGKSEQDFYGNFQTPFRLINNKVIVPDEEEQERNPRSRSAKLRIAEKK